MVQESSEKIYTEHLLPPWVWHIVSTQSTLAFIRWSGQPLLHPLPRCLSVWRHQRVALGRWEGLGVGVSCLPCLILGRSKFLWLHSFFAFLYFITNLLFMLHHCLGFVPRKSYAVSK